MFNKMIIGFSILLMAGIITFTGCGERKETSQVYSEPEDVSFNKAVAVIQPLNGSNVTGVVYFDKVQNGIEIIADIDGLSPGKHGFHIHEFGDLRSNDGTSAGPHFNPENMPHGAPDMEKRHVGDLGNIIALSDKKANYDRVDFQISFSGKHSIIGRSVVIHAGEDDYTTQSSGNAGARIGIGVIGIANENWQ